MISFYVVYTNLRADDPAWDWEFSDIIRVPEITVYGYDGMRGYQKAQKKQEREIMRQAKAFAGLTGVQGRKEKFGDVIVFKPYRLNMGLYIVPVARVERV